MVGYLIETIKKIWIRNWVYQKINKFVCQYAVKSSTHTHTHIHSQHKNLFEQIITSNKQKEEENLSLFTSINQKEKVHT